MRALILAAGKGKRLANHYSGPKCLLEFEGQSLLARHLRLLTYVGIQEIILAVGYEAEQVERALTTLEDMPQAQLVYNDHFNEGSVVSLWALRQPLCAGGEILLMDADVLYDYRLLQRLVQSPHSDCFLLDRDFEQEEEPVKLCLRQGLPIEFRKQVSDDLHYDTIGESVGFFRFSEAVAYRLAARCQYYLEQSYREAPHEEVLRDILLETPARFGVEDITGLPWIEIDFPEDIKHARQMILPQLQPLPGNRAVKF